MLLNDLRLGVRHLVRRPGFAAMAILLLALSAGANAAVFSVVRGVLLRPLPFADPDRLVAVWPEQFVSNDEVAFWRERSRAFEEIASVSPGWLMALAVEGGVPLKVTGARVSDIGAAVQAYVEANGFSVVREFVGHGIGTELHEEPQIPNYGRAGRLQRLERGMALAIEPMVNAGKPAVKVLGDGWTAVTKDGALSAHFEHTVVVTDDGCRVLTLAPEADGFAAAANG